MSTNRLEAFSDGVIAILITVMVLELKIPQGGTWAAMQPMLPIFLIYLLSYVFLGIYWNNHHHMMMLTEHIHGGVLWANLHLLFWLSLVPWATSWVGQNPFAAVPAAIYGVIFFMAGVAWLILQQTIIRSEGESSKLVSAIGTDRKGKASAVLYGAGILLAFLHPWLADALYVAVAIMWLIPDPRMEAVLHSHGEDG